MANWKEFAQAEPSLAQTGANQLFQYEVGLAFLASIRKNGAPRLHPVCPVLSKARLYVLIMPNSPKRLDLERDGRYALQAFPQDKPDSDEFYLSGTARLIDDPAIYADVLADAKHHANPDEILFELEIDRAMHTRWEGFGTPDYRSVHSTWIAT
ncbi:MAG: hypothetical protein A2W35_10665 [Chloroflexi bacterium RBG_16_57_11]|nr:MAG: hypothetical protein A2W35_10665 [Chloroflexi bacterium RBG_16_57_11]